MKKLWALALFDAIPIAGMAPTEVRLASEVEAALAEKDATIVSMKAAFDSACATIDIRDAQLAERDAEIAQLKKELSACMSSGLAVGEQLAAARAEIERLREAIRKLAHGEHSGRDYANRVLSGGSEP